MGGLPKQWTTQWLLDDKQFKGEMRDLAKKSKGLVQGFADLKAAFDAAFAVVAKIGRAFSELVEKGNALNKLYKHNTLSIEEASKATGGFVTQMGLLKAANSAVAFDLGLSAKQLGKMGKAAVVMSQKLGTDATKAMDDLLLGLSRGSRKILDNLGIIVSATAANEVYAASIDKTASELTDAESKTAFMNATIKELDRLTGDASLTAQTAGEEYERLKVAVDDFTASFGSWIISLGQDQGILVSFTDKLRDMAQQLDKIARAPFFKQRMALQARREEVERQIRFHERGASSGEAAVALRGGSTELVEARRKGMKKLLAERAWLEIQSDILVGKARDARTTAAFRTEMDRVKKLAARQLTVDEEIARRKAAAAKKTTKKGIDISKYRVAEGERGLQFGPQIEAEVELAAEAKTTRSLAESVNSLTEANKGFIITEKRKAQALNESAIALQSQTIEAQNAAMQTDAIKNIGAGFIDAADAAIAGTENFGIAILKMLKSVALGLSKELLVHGINALIHSKASASIPVVGPILSAQWGTTAGIYLAGSAALAATGFGLGGIASVAGGGGGGGSSASRSSSGASPSPSFTPRQQKSSQPINITVNVGDAGDPSAILLVKEQVRAQLSQ